MNRKLKIRYIAIQVLYLIALLLPCSCKEGKKSDSSISDDLPLSNTIKSSEDHKNSDIDESTENNILYLSSKGREKYQVDLIVIIHGISNKLGEILVTDNAKDATPQDELIWHSNATDCVDGYSRSTYRFIQSDKPGLNIELHLAFHRKTVDSFDIRKSILFKKMSNIRIEISNSVYIESIWKKINN